MARALPCHGRGWGFESPWLRMKEFQPIEINRTRNYFKSHKFPIEQASLEDKLVNKKIRYYVLPQSLSPDLPDFAFRMTTGRNPATEGVVGIFGVSETVPSLLRPYWALHEIIEFTQMGIDKKGRCSDAERYVLDLVPENLRKEFIEKRIKFFEGVVAYFKKELERKTESYTGDDLKEAEASLLFLQNTQKKELGGQTFED